MADGQTHRKYLNLGWTIVIPLSFLFSYQMYLTGYSFLLSWIFSIYNYWLCRLIDPDADLAGGSKSEAEGARIFNKVPIIGGILRAIWLAYSTLYAGIIMIFGGHRSVTSHGLIIGTIGRIIYFNIPLFLFLRWFYLKNNPVWNINDFWIFYNMDIWFIPYYLSQFIFMSIGDTIHLILDLDMVKGVLYTPIEKRKKDGLDLLKPKYGKFATMIMKVILGYSYNKIQKIIGKGDNNGYR